MPSVSMDGSRLRYAQHNIREVVTAKYCGVAIV